MGEDGRGVSRNIVEEGRGCKCIYRGHGEKRYHTITYLHQFEEIFEKFLVVHGNQIVLPDSPVVLNLGIVTVSRVRDKIEF